MIPDHFADLKRAVEEARPEPVRPASVPEAAPGVHAEPASAEPETVTDVEIPMRSGPCHPRRGGIYQHHDRKNYTGKCARCGAGLE